MKQFETRYAEKHLYVHLTLSGFLNTSYKNSAVFTTVQSQQD